MLGAPGPAPQLWGGVECSIVRIGDRWRDQAVETGHDRRGALDLDRVAELGICVLRYPVLWERCQAGAAGWRWCEERLHQLHDRGISVIAGLIHHGSGPPGTSLLDPAMPEAFAAHAAEAARRFPGVAAWAPVNEPLTTARFSCLYGHWYPHLHDDAAFLRATVNQCRAALLAMRSIRSAVPNACFVQTEDLGRVFSTRPLNPQAAFENERRWLSLDLLCGRVDRTHPWRRSLIDAGVAETVLDELATGEAAPDVIGINHYVTSDRFLDHRLHLYPAHLRGGQGRVPYADTEAARVDLDADQTGWLPRLREAWARYQRPMAVTEAHLGCPDPADQVRWLAEAWDAATTLRAEGVTLLGVTAWALFGLMDWDSMLREERGHYEPGAFDVTADPPRITVLGQAIRDLAKTGEITDPASREPGWWRRDERVPQALRTG